MKPTQFGKRLSGAIDEPKVFSQNDCSALEDLGSDELSNWEEIGERIDGELSEVFHTQFQVGEMRKIFMKANNLNKIDDQ